MIQNRRDVLRSIGVGTTLLVGGTTAAAANPFADDEAENAEVRVLHASPDAPAVDVFVDGSAVLQDVTFETLSGYLELPPGSYDVAVAPAGAGVDNAVIDTTLPVEADTDYTVAATNQLTNIAPTVFVDDNDGGFPPAKPRVRVVHLSPDAPDVDIAISDGPGVREPQVVVEDLSYQDATGYLQLLPTEYEFEVRPAGSDTVVTTVSAALEPGATYTVFAVGLLETDEEDQEFDVLLSEDVPPLSDEDDEEKEVEDEDEDEEDEEDDD